MKKFLMLIILSAAFITSTAQETIFTGNVKDEEGKALAGATISIKGSKVKTQTNNSGDFSIKASNGNVLVVSFNGFSNQSYTLKENTFISIQLKILNNDLNEVVVLGSRSIGRSKLESISPVDLFDLKTLTSEVPQTNLTDILNHGAPSFNSTTQTVASVLPRTPPCVMGLPVTQPAASISPGRKLA